MTNRERIRDEIRREKVEWGVILVDDVEVKRIKGGLKDPGNPESHTVHLEEEDRALLRRGAVFIHNHPYLMMNAFSTEDLAVLLTEGGEAEVVLMDGSFILRRRGEFADEETARLVFMHEGLTNAFRSMLQRNHEQIIRWGAMGSIPLKRVLACSGILDRIVSLAAMQGIIGECGGRLELDYVPVDGKARKMIDWELDCARRLNKAKAGSNAGVFSLQHLRNKVPGEDEYEDPKYARPRW